MGRTVLVIELNEFSFQYRAKQADVWTNDLQGWFDPATFKIYIRKSLDAEQKRRVFLHEFCHCLLQVGGVSEILSLRHEEAVCTAIENLVPFLNFDATGD